MKKIAIGPFCEYWNALPIQLHTHATIYVQRWLPVMKPLTRVDDFGRKHVEHPNCLKLYREHEPITEEMLVSKLGYGDYSFRLNDTRISIKSSPNAATVVYSEMKTKRDWAEHPPVLDPKDLDMDDPANNGYITWARSRGLIPNETQQETEDMQNVQAGVTDRLTSTVERLTDKVIAQAETREKQQPAPVAPAPVPVSSNGDGGALRAMAEVVTAALNRPQPAAAPAADPMVMVRGMVDILKEIKPAQDTSSTDLAKQVVAQAEAANTRIYQLQADQMTAIRAELKEAKAPAAAVVVPAPPSEVDVLERMVKQQSLLKQLTGRGGSHEEEEKPSKLEKYAEIIPLVAPTIGQVIGGFFQFGMALIQGWQVTSYNNALAKNGGAPLAPQTMTNPPEPGKPIPPQAPAQTPEQIAQQQQWNQIIAGVQMLAPHLVRFLDKGKSGADLAEFVIENAEEQRTSYDRIRHLADSLVLIGVQVPGATDLEKFTGACRFVFEKIPALWAKVGTLPTMPQFLADFYHYDDILARAEEEQQQ